MSQSDDDRIYHHIIGFCDRLEWPDPWACIHSGGAVLGVDDADALRDQLTTRFSVERLIHAGALCQTHDEANVLSASLCGDILIPITCSQTGCRLDILTPSGCVSGRPNALSIAIRDEHTAWHLEKADRRLFLSTDLIDVAILRALGLPATLTTGMAQLGTDDMRRLAKLGFVGSLIGKATIGSSSDEPSQPLSPMLTLADSVRRGIEAHREWRYRPTLLAWSLRSRLRDTPDDVGPIIDRLSMLATVMKFDLSQIDVWCPTEAEVSRLEDALGLGDPQCVRDVIRRSARESSSSFPKAAGLVVDSSPTERYLRARRRFRDAIENGRDDKTCEEAENELRDMTQECLIEPLIEEALGIPIPRERIKRIVIADLAGRYFELSACAAHRSTTGQPDLSQADAKRNLADALALAKQMRTMME